MSWRELCSKAQNTCNIFEHEYMQRTLAKVFRADAIYLNIDICREPLIHTFKNINGTVSKKSYRRQVLFFTFQKKDIFTHQKKGFLHIPENNISSQTRGRRWWRGSCCASTQDELQTKVTRHFLNRTMSYFFQLGHVLLFVFLNNILK